MMTKKTSVSSDWDWYIKYLPDIPDIPDELLVLSLDELKDTCQLVTNPIAEEQEIYGGYGDITPRGDKLREFLQPYFDFKIQTIVYQHIGKNIIRHSGLEQVHNTGSSRKRVASWNYIIDLGGDNVVTNWYSGGTEEDTVIHSEIIKPRIWHMFNAQPWHDVKNITGTRFSICLQPRYE